MGSPEETYLATAAQLEAMIAQATGELRRLALARAVTVLPEEAITVADLRREGNRRDLAWQRAVIRAVTRTITLHPQGRGRHPFNPDGTLKIEWPDPSTAPTTPASRMMARHWLTTLGCERPPMRSSSDLGIWTMEG